MGAYTRAELDRIHELRKEWLAESDRRRDQWDAEIAGFTEDQTVYVIEYRCDDNPTWFSATPFYDPVRVQPGETHDEAEAHTVAAKILAGTWGTSKQSNPGSDNVTGVRVIERYSKATIISQTETDVPRETSGSE